MANPLKNLVKSLLRGLYTYYPFRYERVVWLIGSGRSGTTWISAMLNRDHSYRELFEPFHPSLKEFQFMDPHMYLRREDEHMELNRKASRVFKGNYYNSRVEAANTVKQSLGRSYKHLLVKDIFANLLAYNQKRFFPDVKVILLIRNPFAVALSKRDRKHWYWLDEPLKLLDYQNLYADFLKPFDELIREVSNNGSYLDKLIAVWCVINYVPLRQFDAHELLITCYEDWILEPTKELKRVQKYLKIDDQIGISLEDDEAYTQASHTSNTKSQDPNSWRKKITEEEFQSGQKILKAFGFAELYDENSIPNRMVLEEFRNTSGK